MSSQLGSSGRSSALILGIGSLAVRFRSERMFLVEELERNLGQVWSVGCGKWEDRVASGLNKDKEQGAGCFVCHFRGSGSVICLIFVRSKFLRNLGKLTKLWSGRVAQSTQGVYSLIRALAVGEVYSSLSNDYMITIHIELSCSICLLWRLYWVWKACF